MFLFGIGTGHATFNRPIEHYTFEGYTEGFYQIDYVQYYLQYSAGFKYKKRNAQE